MRPAQARVVIGCRMRELREAAEVTLSEAARWSGWHKGHLSRVERGLTKPGAELVAWYDTTFGAAAALVRQLAELEESVRADRATTRRDRRGRRSGGPIYPLTLGGTVPVDYHPDDLCVLVGETVPDGTQVMPGEVVCKIWTLRNAGPTTWLGRFLTRQGTPGVPGWLHSPGRVPMADTGPGELVDVRMRLQAPQIAGACTAYFKMTDEVGRLYFPAAASSPLCCTLSVLEQPPAVCPPVAHRPAAATLTGKEAPGMADLLTDDMKRVVTEQRLGFVATICADSTPNLSPKSTTAVWDDSHLMFADLSSPQTVANLRHNPAVEINVVDPLAGTGYRFKGSGTVLTGGPLYEQALNRLKSRMAAPPDLRKRVNSIVLVKVERALPLTSPAHHRHTRDDQIQR